MKKSSKPKPVKIKQAYWKVLSKPEARAVAVRVLGMGEEESFTLSGTKVYQWLSKRVHRVEGLGDDDIVFSEADLSVLEGSGLIREPAYEFLVELQKASRGEVELPPMPGEEPKQETEVEEEYMEQRNDSTPTSSAHRRAALLLRSRRLANLPTADDTREVGVHPPEPTAQSADTDDAPAGRIEHAPGVDLADAPPPINRDNEPDGTAHVESPDTKVALLLRLAESLESQAKIVRELAGVL